MSANPSRRNPVSVAFGRALKAARNKIGLSQEAFAERADLDRTTPSLWERGLRSPTLARLVDIARVLRVEPTQLLADTLEHLRREEP
jgi:transcriptional regulator with XRE-family HTH domain